MRRLYYGPMKWTFCLRYQHIICFWLGVMGFAKSFFDVMKHLDYEKPEVVIVIMLIYCAPKLK